MLELQVSVIFNCGIALVRSSEVYYNFSPNFWDVTILMIA